MTGASRGLGRAISNKLAEAGATIALHYNKNMNDAESLAQILGNESKAFQADLADPGEAVKLFERVLLEMGSIEVLINNESKIFIRKNQITRAVMNILDNADKFAEKIFISSNLINNKWEIDIEDNGPGTTLSQEELIRPFVKGSDQLNQGTGLGLSIVQKLIKLNNGELNFQKSSHGGLKVTVILQI